MNVLSASGLKSSNLFNEHGSLSREVSWNKLEDDIRVLLMTTKGTLIGDPNFGSNLFNLIYQPASNSSASLMRTEISNCIGEYYPEISITYIDVVFSDTNVNFDIGYKIANTNTINKLVLMFIKSGQYLV